MIWKASTLQEIANSGGSCLIIINENVIKINNIIGNNKNPGQVYTCIVKKGGSEDNPQITEVV